MRYDAKREWTEFYLGKKPGGKTYPNEYVVRIFMGSYPRLNFDNTFIRKDGRFVLEELEGLDPENLRCAETWILERSGCENEVGEKGCHFYK